MHVNNESCGQKSNVKVNESSEKEINWTTVQYMESSREILRIETILPI